MNIVVVLCCLFSYCIWCELSEDGDIMAPKHIGAMYKNVRVSFRIPHLFLLHELVTSS